VVDEAQHERNGLVHPRHEVSGSRFILGLSATPYRTDTLKLAFRRVVGTRASTGSSRKAGCVRITTVAGRVDARRRGRGVSARADKWGKSVAFFHTIEQCHHFATLLAAAGLRCEVVTAKNRPVRPSSMPSTRGEFRIVANVAILNEGFDWPGSANRVRARRLEAADGADGRPRLPPAPGKTHCNIVQSRNARWPFTRTARPQRA